MTKTLSKLCKEGIYLNTIKKIPDKFTTVIIFNREKPETFALRSGARQGCTFSPLLFNTALEVLARAIRQGKNYKECTMKGNKSNYYFLEMT